MKKPKKNLKNTYKTSFNKKEEKHPPLVQCLVAPEQGLLDIVFSNADFLIINKSAGLQVHPDKNNKKHTLANFLIYQFPELKEVGEDPWRPAIVHRLDRDTVGLIIIPKNQSSFSFFKEAFQQRKIKKTYWALVYGSPVKKEGIIELPIGQIIKKGKALRSTSSNSRNQKNATTHYRVLEEYLIQPSPSRSFNYALLEVKPTTGRTHQIRVHLKALGHPLVGDPLYKFKRQTPPFQYKNLFLVAKELDFTGPRGAKFNFSIPLDASRQELLKKLKAFAI